MIVRSGFAILVLLFASVNFGCTARVEATPSVNGGPVAPSITTQPTSQTVTTGEIASFIVAATGAAPLSYQWDKNGVAISGATSASYTTPATTSSDNGAQFTVLVSNTAGRATSDAAMLTVNAAPAPGTITVLTYGPTGTGQTECTAPTTTALASPTPPHPPLFSSPH